MPCSALRQRDLADLAAEPLDRRQGRLEDLAHAGVDAVSRELAGHAEAQALQILAVGRLIPPSIPTEVESQRIAALQRPPAARPHR